MASVHNKNNHANVKSVKKSYISNDRYFLVRIKKQPISVRNKVNIVESHCLIYLETVNLKNAFATNKQNVSVSNLHCRENTTQMKVVFRKKQLQREAEESCSLSAGFETSRRDRAHKKALNNTRSNISTGRDVVMSGSVYLKMVVEGVSS